jgi:hypothetical protein
VFSRRVHILGILFAIGFVMLMGQLAYLQGSAARPCASEAATGCTGWSRSPRGAAASTTSADSPWRSTARHGICT